MLRALCWGILCRHVRYECSLLVSRMLDCSGLSPGACDKRVAQGLGRLGHMLGSNSEEGELTGLLR